MRNRFGPVFISFVFDMWGGGPGQTTYETARNRSMAKYAGRKMRSRALTGNIDFAPTILELAGLPVPDHVDGRSLLPLLKNPDADIREQMAFINVWGSLPTQSLTCLTKDWKYTYWWYGDDRMKPVEELFPLRKDPFEMTNLTSNPEAASMLAAMRGKYDTELAKWKKEAVPYNSYQQYGKLFDRNIPWDRKKMIKEKK